MTTYELWRYDWKNELSPDERRIYEFQTFIELMNYARIQILAHNYATMHYDKDSDTIYMEE